MENIIYGFGIAFLIVLITMEISCYFVYGGFITKEVEEIYMNLDESKLRLNSYNASILSTNRYITNVPFSLFTKYHIEDLGRIPRWSKLHKQVNRYFSIALRNEMK